MNISAALVKDLRERTGSGMMECKKALVEAGGDIEAAVEIMRKSGLAKADKKSSRTAAEGRISVKTSADSKIAVVLEINSETDFVAKNDDFIAFANGRTIHRYSKQTRDTNNRYIGRFYSFDEKMEPK